MHSFGIESFGVKIRFVSNRKRLLERVRSFANVVLLGDTREIAPSEADHEFSVTEMYGELSLKLGDEDLGVGQNPKAFYHYFDSRIRLLVAEYSVDRVFIHCGVVGWNGKAILFPGDSFDGKSTIVKAFLKKGAIYYSDEYAVIDSEGLVYPFARKLSIRDPDDAGRWQRRSPEVFGSVAGTEPLVPAVVILSRYKPNAKWQPKILTPANGMLRMIPQTIPLKKNPKFALKVLKKISERAIIAKSPRCHIDLCIDELVIFVDKCTI